MAIPREHDPKILAEEPKGHKEVKWQWKWDGESEQQLQPFHRL